jgi:hypothetical protein
MTGYPYLFIGGPKDGQRLVVDRESVVFFETQRGTDGTCDDTKYEYSALRIAGDTEEFCVYVLSSLSPDEMLRHLIQRYPLGKAGSSADRIRPEECRPTRLIVVDEASDGTFSWGELSRGSCGHVKDTTLTKPVLEPIERLILSGARAGSIVIDGTEYHYSCSMRQHETNQ